VRNLFARTTAEVTLQEPQPSAGAETLRPSADLGALIRQAAQIGQPRLIQMDDGDRWYAYINFRTIAGITLEAKSSFKANTPEAAVEEAIEKARQIMAQFK
jgi:hypothetical protein